MRNTSWQTSAMSARATPSRPSTRQTNGRMSAKTRSKSSLGWSKTGGVKRSKGVLDGRVQSYQSELQNHTEVEAEANGRHAKQWLGAIRRFRLEVVALQRNRDGRSQNERKRCHEPIPKRAARCERDRQSAKCGRALESVALAGDRAELRAATRGRPKTAGPFRPTANASSDVEGSEIRALSRRCFDLLRRKIGTL